MPEFICMKLNLTVFRRAFYFYSIARSCRQLKETDQTLQVIKIRIVFQLEIACRVIGRVIIFTWFETGCLYFSKPEALTHKVAQLVGPIGVTYFHSDFSFFSVNTNIHCK